jgi:hypothetical protein
LRDLEAAQLGVGAFELLALLVVLLGESVGSPLELFVSGLGGGEADAQGSFAGRG